MATEKFSHLDNLPPNVDSILKIPVDRIDDEHLLVLRDNLSKFSKSLNFNVARAAVSVIKKIDDIINLGKSRVSGEIMELASNYESADKGLEYFDKAA